MDRFEETKLRIKEAVDLVGLIEGYVALRRRGRTLVGLCPFHDEKTPSFTVYSDTQHYHCYGCGKAGDVFTFVQEREGLSFSEAFVWLGEKASVPTEGVLGRGRKGPDRPRVDQILGVVRGWFRHQLQTPAGDRARAYLEERGFDAAVESFGLGYHPDPRREGNGTPSLHAFAKERGLPPQILAEAGLLKRSQRGDIFEPFRGRLMFPIEDEMGRVVGFGGRVLPGDDGPPEGDPSGFRPPKYLNSPESPFFNKRRVLFGLRHAKAAGQRRIVVMEGYTDVIACHLAGTTGAVATLGTALTTDHAKLLRRWADEGVVLLFDGDRAGRQAAEKAYRELAATDLDLRIALAPEGSDPADLVRAAPAGDAPGGDAPGDDGQGDDAQGGGRLAALVDGAEDALTTWFRLLRDRMDFSQPVHVERAAAECAKVLARLDNEVRRQATQARMASFLGVTPAALGAMVRAEAARSRARARPPARADDAARGGAARDGAAAGAEGAASREVEYGMADEAEAAAAETLSPEDWERATPAPNPRKPGPDSQDRPRGSNRDGSGTPENGRRAAPERTTPLGDADLLLLATVLAEPTLHPCLDGVSFSDPSHQALGELFVRGVGKGLKSREALARFAFSEMGEKPELARILARCTERSASIQNPAEFLQTLIQGRTTYVAQQNAQDLRRQAQQALAAGDRAEADRLTRLYIELSRQRMPRANPPDAT